MSLRPLASLLVKMLGLYAIVNALPILSGILGPFANVAPAGFPALKLALLNASGGALQMLVGIGLWFFSDGIAHSAVPQDGDIPVRRDEGLTAIGFSVVGASLLANAVVKIGQFAATRSALSTLGSASGSAGMVDMYTNLHVGAGDFVVILVQAGIGVYLLLGGRGVARGVANFRNVGRDAEPQESA